MSLFTTGGGGSSAPPWNKKFLDDITDADAWLEGVRRRTAYTGNLASVKRVTGVVNTWNFGSGADELDSSAINAQVGAGQEARIQLKDQTGTNGDSNIDLCPWYTASGIRGRVGCGHSGRPTGGTPDTYFDLDSVGVPGVGDITVAVVAAHSVWHDTFLEDSSRSGDAQTQYILWSMGSSGSPLRYKPYGVDDGTWELAIQNAALTYLKRHTLPQPPSGSNVHIVRMGRTHGSVDVYINGEEWDTETWDPLIDTLSGVNFTNENFRFGASSKAFLGVCNAYGRWPRALTDSEIEDLSRALCSTYGIVYAG